MEDKNITAKMTKLSHLRKRCRKKDFNELTSGTIEQDSDETKRYFEKVGRWISRQVRQNKKKVFMATCCGALQARSKPVDGNLHPRDVLNVNIDERIEDARIPKDLIGTLVLYRTCDHLRAQKLIPRPFVSTKHVALCSCTSCAMPLAEAQEDEQVRRWLSEAEH